MAIRSSIIRHTAETFAPNLFIVDKEPLGLNEELQETLSMMKGQGTTLVLGLRDIMDEPTLLRREWNSKKLLPVLKNIYDEIWVYGHEDFWDPLREMDVPRSVRKKMIYTGYLRRTVPQAAKVTPPVDLEGPYILVTAGGGGDGDQMIDCVLQAYETKAELARAILVLGPFMRPEMQSEVRERAKHLENVEVLTFDTHLELLMERALGVVAMGGYNTFCEILSMDKPALIMPRIAPRKEQLVRAMRAAELGIAQTIIPSKLDNIKTLVEALKALPYQPKPSVAVFPRFLDGIENIGNLAGRHFHDASKRQFSLIETIG